jgi:hypothetical protein
LAGTNRGGLIGQDKSQGEVRKMRMILEVTLRTAEAKIEEKISLGIKNSSTVTRRDISQQIAWKRILREDYWQCPAYIVKKS